MKVVIIVRAGSIESVQCDVAHCEVDIVDCDSLNEAEHDNALKRAEEIEGDPALFQIA